MIYIYKHNIDGKVYIGQTNDTKKRFHISSYKTAKKVYEAMIKFNYDFSDTEILKTVESVDEANKLEAKYIEMYNSITDGWNARVGGLHREQKPIGRRSKDYCEKLSKAMLGNKNQRPRTQSDETKKKQSEKIKELYKNGVYDTSKRMRQVIHIQTGEEFNSIKLAADAFNIDPSTIKNHCNNKVKEPKFMFKKISSQASESN